MCRTYHGKYEVFIPPFHWRDWKEMEIHPNLESAFVILNILYSMCCNSCFEACQACLQKHHPWSKQDNQSNPVKTQGGKTLQIQDDGVLQRELGFLNHWVLFLRGKFRMYPFPPSSYPQIKGVAPCLYMPALYILPHSSIWMQFFCKTQAINSKEGKKSPINTAKQEYSISPNIPQIIFPQMSAFCSVCP